MALRHQRQTHPWHSLTPVTAAFEECGHDKFISLLWKCRAVRDAMYECYKAQ